MRNLIQKISTGANIPEEKAKQIVIVVTEHMKQEFPLLSSVVDLVLEIESMSRKRKVIIDLPKHEIIYN